MLVRRLDGDADRDEVPELPDEGDDSSDEGRFRLSEIAETYAAMREIRKAESAKRRAWAALEFPEAKRLAAEAGLRLVKSGDFYFLEAPGKGWRLSLYPGNQRIYGDRNRPKAPYLNVESWSLRSIVLAAIEAEKGGQS